MGLLVSTVGLHPCGAFYRDWPFLAAIGMAGGFWLILGWLTPVTPLSWQQMASWPFLSLALWQPCGEELVFRGLLQGYVSRQAWGQWSWRELTGANLGVSLLFMLGHLWQHPPLWALAVLPPSLLFGWMRDRYRSVYPAMVLHMLYNAGYFGLTGLPT